MNAGDERYTECDECGCVAWCEWCEWCEQDTPDDGPWGWWACPNCLDIDVLPEPADEFVY